MAQINLTSEEIRHLLARVSAQCQVAFCSCCDKSHEGAVERRDFKRALRRKLAAALNGKLPEGGAL